MAIDTLRHRDLTSQREKKSLHVSVPRWFLTLTVLCVSVVIAGCRQDMHDQPKYIPLRQSTFFSDARSARPIVGGTVARGQLHDDQLLYTGKVDGTVTDVFPLRVDAQMMTRGRDRY